MVKNAENSISFEKIENAKIPENSKVRVTIMNHIIEVQYLEKMCSESHIKKIDKDRYLVLVGENAGEIKEFEHIENRSEDISSLKRTFKKMRYYINNNFTGGKNELFITLTYKENMRDTKRLYVDFKNFIKRLKYKFDNQNITFDYFSVVEPQGRGAWHIHALFKFSCKYIYIANSDLAELWGQGFVNVHRIQEVDNIGAYLTAYLSDFEIKENISSSDELSVLMEVLQKKNICEEKEVEIDGKKVKKRFIKGGRLVLYPPGVNLFRKSKGIIYPERLDTIYDEEFKENVLKSAQPQHISGIELKKYSEQSQSDEHFNSIIFESYNLLRSPL